MNQCNRIVLYVIATLFNTSTSAIAQDSVIDSLKNLLATATDTTKVDLLIDIGKLYMAQEKHNNAFINYSDALKLSEEIQNKERLFQSLFSMGQFYEYAVKKHEDALQFAVDAQKIAEEQDNKQELFDVLELQLSAYRNQGNLSKVVYYGETMLKVADKLDDYQIRTVRTCDVLSDVYFELKDYGKALNYAQKSLAIYKKHEDILNESYVCLTVQKIYVHMGNYKEAYHYLSRYNLLRDSMTNSSETYKNMDLVLADDSLLRTGYKAEKQKRQIESFKRESLLQSKLRNVLIGSLVLLLIIAFLVFNKYRLKKKAEIALTSKNEELNRALNELKSAQAQLIQSEKMASLGQLTAGIAHEIQNPLNFVNNFSEVNTELIAEMKDELKAGNNEDAIAIANDIADNEQKINHHGKRADAIVKGMLQHSRISSGQKEFTDINLLADEYLRLSYHGLRAKDKTFNATMKTDFDATIGKIKIVPQDIGRVLLNLFNNAFYSVTEKKKQSSENYEPSVSVCTKNLNDKIEIHVRDNGTGIPQKAIDKIFQPFFTTKPTGQGTGLGLSLSYDIIKAHGGEIRVETKDGEGAEFILQLSV